MNDKFLPLYIAKCLEVLETFVEKDDTVKNLRKSTRFSNVANKMLSELLQCQDDQEKCYILCRRYINLLDHIIKTSDDENYTRSMFFSDYRKVKQLTIDIKSSLEYRYATEIQFDYELESMDSIKPPSSSSSNEKEYIKPNVVVVNGESKGPSMFEEKFVTPSDLFTMMMQKQNMLLVDVRKSEHFKDCRIHIHVGVLINIPGELILPGLSANTLGQHLEPEVRDIWEHREKFDVIVLMDYDTVNHTYAGSKLEHLRSFIVEWDFNRIYKQEPFILSGGLKEFVEWYPSEVDNSEVFLSQTNSEIDELLDLESVTYPETGTGIHMNLKIHPKNSIGNLGSRITRDFTEMEEDLFDVPPFHSRSEGNLPVDFFVSKDSLPVGPFTSLSQESLPREYSSIDQSMESIFPPQIIGEHSHPSKFLAADETEEAAAMDEANEIEELLRDEKAALLRQAREAVKPIMEYNGYDFEVNDMNRGETEDENQMAMEGEFGLENKMQIKAPSLNRSNKPSLAEMEVDVGEGYTGLKNHRNICYMNCMLQCLKVLPVIKSTYVTSNRYLNYQTRDPPKINPHMAAVMTEIWGGTYYNHKVFLIQKFKEKIVEMAPMYDRNTHEDTFEFFMFLFNLLSDDCAMDLPRPSVMTESEKAWYGHLQGRTSFLVNTFYHQLKNTKECWKCRRPNLSFETDSTLMLPVYQSTCYLQSLIDDYIKENLVADYSCSDCKCTATIVNVKEIVVDPDVLVIVLKRYIANPDGTFRKNEAPIEFPLEGLKFGSSKYSCYGIVQHSGTMVHGHYYSSVLLDDRKKHWVLFNDEQVTRYSTSVNECMGIKISAAGFFYVRKST